MNTLLQDIRYGLRMLLKYKGFTAVAVIALGLGIGANTAIFSLVNGVLLRPLPFKDAQELAVIQEVKEDNSWNPASYDDITDFKTRQHSFSEIATVSPAWTFTFSGSGDPRQLDGQYISANLFSLLGVTPIRGRTFLPEEDATGSQQRVVILSHGFWQREFGKDPGVIGRTIMLDDAIYTVVGIMPPGLKVNGEAELWIPLPLNPLLSRGRAIRFLACIGRLHSNIEFPQAQAEFGVLAQQLEKQYPDTNKGFGVQIIPMQEHLVGRMRPALLVLLAAVGFVLLIACANVANLTLSRAVMRRKEVAIRGALGASRMRLVRQFLTESLLLSIGGGLLGLVLATWGIDLLRSFGPADIPRRDEIGLDGSVLLFSLFISFLTGLVFGSAPAWKASRADLNETLNETGKGGVTGVRHQYLRGVLIVTEIALAIILLTGAGLLVRSFARLLDVHPGFDVGHILAVTVTLPPSKYGQPAQRAVYYQQLEERLKTLPGVIDAGAISRLPFFERDLTSGRSNITSDLIVEGEGPPAPGDEPSVDYRVASPSYFHAMGIPLIQGRFFSWQDQPQSEKRTPLVVVINAAMARRYWPGQEPVGKRIKVGLKSADLPWLTVVGVVGDVRHFSLDREPRPEVYRPYLVNPLTGPIVVVRAKANPQALIPLVREQMRALDPSASISDFSTMEELVSRSVSERRFSMLLLAVFAVVALILAAVGIYGVMAYSVTQRTHEIGIRMALGAQRGHVLKLIVRQGMSLTMIGVGVGVIAAMGLTQLTSKLLFGVRATDPATYLGMSLLLTLVALFACYLPARRAARFDPVRALAQS